MNTQTQIIAETLGLMGRSSVEQFSTVLAETCYLDDNEDFRVQTLVSVHSKRSNIKGDCWVFHHTHEVRVSTTSEEYNSSCGDTYISVSDEEQSRFFLPMTPEEMHEEYMNNMSIPF